MLPVMKLKEAEFAFLGPSNQSLVCVDINMEMGKEMGRLSRHLCPRPHRRCNQSAIFQAK